MVTLKIRICTAKQKFDLTESPVAVRVAPEKSIYLVIKIETPAIFPVPVYFWFEKLN